MYTHNLHQAAKDIVIVAMWFERARSFSASGWDMRHTLPPRNDDWNSNSAGRFLDAWNAGWEKGRREMESGVKPSAAMGEEWLAPWRIGEWMEG